MGLFPRKDIIRIDIPKDIGEEFTDLSSGGGEIGSLIAQALRDWLDGRVPQGGKSGSYIGKTYIRLGVPDRIVEEFRILARDTGDSVNRIIAQALRDWLDEKERRDRGNSRSDRRDVW